MLPKRRIFVSTNVVPDGGKNQTKNATIMNKYFFLLLSLIMLSGCNSGEDKSLAEDRDYSFEGLSKIDNPQLQAYLNVNDFGTETPKEKIEKSLKTIIKVAGIPNISINYKTKPFTDFGFTNFTACNKKEIWVNHIKINEWSDLTNSVIPYHLVSAHELAHFIYEHNSKNSNYSRDEFEADLFAGKILRNLGYDKEEVIRVIDSLSFFIKKGSSMKLHAFVLGRKKIYVEFGWLERDYEIFALTHQYPTTKNLFRRKELAEEINIDFPIPDSIYFNDYHPIPDSYLNDSREKTLSKLLEFDSINFTTTYSDGFYFYKNYGDFWRDGNLIIKMSNSVPDTIGTINSIKDKSLLKEYREEIIIGENAFLINKNGYILGKSIDENLLVIGLTYNKNKFLKLTQQ